MFDIKENYQIARKLALGGMVLLKNNEKVLPFVNTDKISIIGSDCLSLIKGGGGSADVKSEYVRSLEYGLFEKHHEGKILRDEESIHFAKDKNNYSVEELNLIAKSSNKSLVTIRRSGTEGSDRDISTFVLSETEKELLDCIECSKINNLVLILNVCAISDFSFIKNYSKIKSVLLVFLPGMEGGTAIADILCGDEIPSGKLVDTIAHHYEDYPSAQHFDTYPTKTEYKEDIYVGYRYFETFAKEKVMYPFGFGLSYTEFDYFDCKIETKENKISAFANIKNIGEYPGREIAQVYISAPNGKLEKPALELKGYTKTDSIEIGQTVSVKVDFDINSMASFDTDTAAYILEEGDYRIYIGKSVRDLNLCSIYHVNETIVTQKLSNCITNEPFAYQFDASNDAITGNKGITIYDVANNKATMDELVNQMSVEELISVAHGQPPMFALGTAGIGNLSEYGVVNAQTADGPVGVRRSIPTTCFPCSTLIACSWDESLQVAMGKAMGYEGVNTDVDILLAPALNIHRNHLCGRNFEYFSEDPLISGNTAANIVNGVQNEGLCATIKHFAANNRECNRKNNSSIISERALREIYLKNFEITIKKSDPAFLMTSYNLINGIKTSTNPYLLRGLLRDEWGYQGAIMTDWRNNSSLDDEIIAGNNIKMPYGFPDEAQRALNAYRSGKIPLAALRENAKFVFRAVMKTKKFKDKNFGIIHQFDDGKITIPALKVNGISSTRILQSKTSDGIDYLYHLGVEQRSQRTFVFYTVESENEKLCYITLKVATDATDGEIWVYDENNIRMCSISNKPCTNLDDFFDLSGEIKLHKGVNKLKIVFAAEPDKEYEYQDWAPLPPTDYKLSGIIISEKS